MPSGNPIITLLSDFGDSDPYVGSMKGVILSICPQAQIVDLVHNIAAHQIVNGAVALETAYAFFPAGAIHLAVVDPGVGSERRSIAAQAGHWYFVAPDNGLLTLILKAHPDHKIVALEESAYHLPAVSRTFAGRDVFAPAAAYLGTGVPLEALGPPVFDPVLLDLPEPDFAEDCIAAHVIYVDHFGNCFCDLREVDFREWCQKRKPSGLLIGAGKVHLRKLSQSYSEVATGKPLAIFSSSGRLEVAVNQGSASEQLGLSVGHTVEISAV
jgi:hypothetical protein